MAEYVFQQDEHSRANVSAEQVAVELDRIAAKHGRQCAPPRSSKSLEARGCRAARVF
jgi:hypothetical protein